MAALFLLWANPAPASEPVYLAQPWFHRGPDVNVLTTHAGVELAVDNAGRYLADDSITLKNNRFNRLALDSLQACAGEYYIACPNGYQGNGVYTWYRITREGKFLDAAAVADAVKARASAMESYGFCLDGDARYGIPGLLLFPKAGLAVLRARSTLESEFFSVVPFGPQAAPVAFTNKDSVELAFEPPPATPRGRRSGTLPAGVIADPDGLGFWAIGSATGKVAVIHSRPALKPDGGRTLNLSAIIPVGEVRTESFEAGIASEDALFLLLARLDNAIGGVSPQRRLVRVGLADGKVTEVPVSLDCYLKEAALTLCANRVVAYARHDVKALDSKTLQPVWDKDTALLLGSALKDYNVYRVTASPEGNRLAVALATAYRRPNESTRVIELDAAGEIQQRWLLKPGSIDDMTFTSDGGWLLFSPDYTAKLGGTIPVRENETASMARADKTLAAEKPNKTTAPASTEVAFVKAPLEQRHKVWFGAPGGEFLPLGNGILGAMMYGDTDSARIILDVDSEWAGDETHQGTFQSLGEINFRLGHNPKEVTDFRRELDLRTGLLTMTYRYQGVTYKSEAFCSYPLGLLAVRFTADKPGSFSGQLELTARQDATFTKGKEGIEFSGQKPNSQKFACVMRVNTQGGEVLPAAGKDGERDTSSKLHKYSETYKSILLQGCDSVTLYVAGDTDYALDPTNHFKGADPRQKLAPRLANIGKMSFDQMKQESMADVARLFDRCTLDLATSMPQAETLPVDKRRISYRNHQNQNDGTDVGFQALAFDAARYLMIACSRLGSLPANLQGLWNPGNGAEWTGDYHTDINIEMNYWFVEPANLAECATPLFDYIESQIPYWRKKAKLTFGEKVRGWTVDYMNNIFGAGTYMNYPPGSAWLAWHYAQHFEFGQNMNFLQERAYPVLKELSEHWQDLLIKRPDGLLTTPKTSSPEHGPFQYGIAQDRQMVFDLLNNYLSASARLKCDTDFAKQVEELRARIIPPKIGRWGQVQEWETDEDSRYCTHRHMMHLFAAFPGKEINPLTTPELSVAAVKSVVARGDGSTGWSKAWRASIYARLHRTDLAYRALSSVVGGFHDNLIWEGKSQIDAPCGYASGVCEILLQSHQPLDNNNTRYQIALLPALPSAWPAGTVKGLRARGGYEVDIEWKDGKLTRATLHNISSPTGECTVRYQGVDTKLTVPPGQSKVFAGNAPAAK